MTNVQMRMTRRNPYREEFIATLTTGEWPTDDELLKLADPYGAPFGGEVTPVSPTEKRVIVNVD